MTDQAVLQITQKSMKTNPFKDRDLNSELRFPTLSWSSYQAFTEYNKEEWYQKYVLGNRGHVNSAMQAGIEIGERLATSPKYLPEVPRPEIYEYTIKVKFGKINLRGHIDGWSPSSKTLVEYKTTQNKKRWDDKSVLKHGQIDFYCLLLFLKENIRPEELTISLVSIPVEMGGDFKVKRSKEKIQIIPTKRTMIDILNFGVKLKQTFKEMQEYVDNRRLTDTQV